MDAEGPPSTPASLLPGPVHPRGSRCLPGTPGGGLSRLLPGNPEGPPCLRALGGEGSHRPVSPCLGEAVACPPPCSLPKVPCSSDSGSAMDWCRVTQHRVGREQAGATDTPQVLAVPHAPWGLGIGQALSQMPCEKHQQERQQAHSLLTTASTGASPPACPGLAWHPDVCTCRPVRGQACACACACVWCPIQACTGSRPSGCTTAEGTR